MYVPLYRHGELSPPTVATPGHIHQANMVACCRRIGAPFRNCVGERASLVEQLHKHLERCVELIRSQFMYAVHRILRYPTRKL
jgi:hypothetical protein